MLNIHWKQRCWSWSSNILAIWCKEWLIGKDPDAEKDWQQEEKGNTEGEKFGWHHQLNGHEFEQAPGDSEGQGNLVYCSPWGPKESDTTEQLNNNNKCLINLYSFCSILDDLPSHPFYLWVCYYSTFCYLYSVMCKVSFLFLLNFPNWLFGLSCYHIIIWAFLIFRMALSTLYWITKKERITKLNPSYLSSGNSFYNIYCWCPFA